MISAYLDPDTQRCYRLRMPVGGGGLRIHLTVGVFPPGARLFSPFASNNAPNLHLILNNHEYSSSDARSRGQGHHRRWGS